MPNLEVKQIQNLEVKASDGSNGKRFEGYLAYFDNVDSYGDIIVKGAFANSLAQTKQDGKFSPILEQHGGWGISSQDYTPLGYYESLVEDSKGLYAKGILYDTTRGSDIYTLLKQSPQGFMGQSIGFNIIGEKKPTEEEYRSMGVRRYLTEIKLVEGSIVTFPANEKARVEDVKMAEAKKRRDLETHLKDNGFSSSEAKKVVAVLSKYEGKAEMEDEPENNIEEKSTEGLTSLRGVFKSVQEQLETENSLRSLKKFMSDFPSKVLKS